MREDSVLSLSEYKNMLLGMSYEEKDVNYIVNLKIKQSVLGIIGRDNRVASKRKLTVVDLVDYLNRCMALC